MLDVLKNTGLNARLTPKVYDLYKNEASTYEKSWKQSLHYLDTCNFSFTGGSDDSHIPAPYCQYDYADIIYDCRGCRKVDGQVPDGYKTIFDGGTALCAMKSVLDYFHISLSLEDVGKDLVQNGYRTENDGTLWIAFDKAFEQLYGVQTQMQSMVFELCESVSLLHPVIALVSAAWLHDYPMPSNECIIIWRLEGKEAVITMTSSHSSKKVDLYELLKNIKRAWACQRKN